MYRLIFIVFLPLLAFTCEKPANQTCYEAKVIRTSCASFVVQILNNDTLGEDGWKDITSEQSYDNVINITNRCELPQNFSEGSVFQFTVRPDVNTECVTCYMYDAPPVKAFQVNLCGN